MVKILDFYQDKIKSYANEIDHAKHDHELTNEQKLETISELVAKEHKFIMKINQFIQRLKIIANCSAE